jgi:hypothetical protein
MVDDITTNNTTVTLWNGNAKQETSSWEGNVLGISGCRIEEYKGKRHLSTFDSSCFEVNPPSEQETSMCNVLNDKSRMKDVAKAIGSKQDRNNLCID